MVGRLADLPGRIRNKIDPNDAGCWIWTASQRGPGYGGLKVGGKMWLAHRYVYEIVVGAIPPGLHLDHLCRTRLCVSPTHLEAVTPAENNRRSPKIISTINAAKTHCPRLHLYQGANLYVDRTGKRECRECQRITQRARRARYKLWRSEA